ncbi:hypothetical protein [Nocardioides sp.]|uniref:hypothetical protein n=1 Tax=Nocardioides sp. TaxID=35761 RepID=UPI0025E829B6|nr:hypothetical protein [Nocardioides sp.]
MAGCVLVAGCSSTEPGTGGGGDCESHYSGVTMAPTWAELKTKLLASEEWARTASARVQHRGTDIGVGDEDVVRVVDLLNAQGRRVVQLEVWRTADGGWSAGAWSQCID